MVVDQTGRWAPAGALTTAFTPPASCFENLYYSGGGGTVTLGQFSEQPECYPTQYWEKFWGEDAGYYSPRVCPSRYTSACGRQTSNVLGKWYTVGPEVIAGETAVKCCPQ